MREAIAYAKQREQFGRTIGSFEIIQRKIATLAAECYALDSAVMVTAGMVDRGGIDFSLETAACKVFASELAFRASNEALQIAGGIGYSKEYPYEQAVRDSRINLIFEGTNEMLRALIALMGLQQPGERLKALGTAFKEPIRSLGAIGEYLAGRARRQITKPRFTLVHPALEREAGLIETLVHDLALGVEDAILRHGKAIIDRQFLQERMANAAIDIYPGDDGALAHHVGDRARGRRGWRRRRSSIARASSFRWRIVARDGAFVRCERIRTRGSRRLRRRRWRAGASRRKSADPISSV